MQQAGERLKAGCDPRWEGTRVGDAAPGPRLVKQLLACFVSNFFETRDLIGLGTLASLNDVEFNLVALLRLL